MKYSKFWKSFIKKSVLEIDFCFQKSRPKKVGYEAWSKGKIILIK